jgi:hypothetical protein
MVARLSACQTYQPIGFYIEVKTRTTSVCFRARMPKPMTLPWKLESVNGRQDIFAADYDIALTGVPVPLRVDE